MSSFKTIELPSIETMGSSDGFSNLEQAKQLLLNQAATVQEAFLAFADECATLLDQAEAMVATVGDSDPVMVDERLNELVAKASTVGYYRAEAETFLNIYEMLGHCPKQKTLNDIDRKRHAEIASAIPKLLLEKLRNVEKWLEKKISVSQSILKKEVNRPIR
jgi:hypothetical protein